MADTLVQRLTGASGSATAVTGGLAAASSTPDSVTADVPTCERPTCERVNDECAAPTGEGVTLAVGGVIEVQIVMTDRALFAGEDDPALVSDNDASGSSPAADYIPARVARDLVRDAGMVFVRRLYTDPTSGQLVGMESSRRVFDGNLRKMLIQRDRICRTPWCDAPIRHGDHITPAAHGGPTSYRNGQGLCGRCNQTKNLPGWSANVLDEEPGGPTERHIVRTTTPTGHTYDSTAPPVLRPTVNGAARSRTPARDPRRTAIPHTPALRPTGTER
jgi:hypothetical protein